ncbi:MAG: hypothetical protein KDD00_05505 [Ignavibacteriae bacterium]|nr:hypothetical protein [Ignavibacteriota bacterium]
MKNFSDKTLIVKVILLTSFLSLHTTTISLGTNAYNRTSDLISRSDPAYSDFPEHYFRFPLKPGVDLNVLTHIISLDNVKDGFVYAYANEEQWTRIKKYGLEIKELSRRYNYQFSTVNNLLPSGVYFTDSPPPQNGMSIRKGSACY